MPTAWALMPMRPLSSAAMAMRKPAPSAPSRLAAGTPTPPRRAAARHEPPNPRLGAGLRVEDHRGRRAGARRRLDEAGEVEVGRGAAAMPLGHQQPAQATASGLLDHVARKPLLVPARHLRGARTYHGVDVLRDALV